MKPKQQDNKVAACRKAAEKGDAEAQYRLGRMYDDGTGVGQSSAMAARWYRKAAEQGQKTAIKRLQNLQA